MCVRKYTIVGGDLRNIKLADLLAADGNEVNVYGFKNAGFDVNIRESEDLKTAIDDSNIIIGPLPCSNDNESLTAPFHPEKVHMNEVFKSIGKNQLFIAGRISEKVAHMAQAYNVYAIDILEREEMAVLNAIPTAEGAIQIAMEEMPITLHSCKALVLGYGRVGRMLAKSLAGLNAEVYVEARKYSDIAWIKSLGYKPVYISELSDYAGQMDVIFNTVPHLIISSDVLEKINKESLVLDLASKPGGVDFERAKALGIKVIWALSLPGKVAPVTAAKYIKETVYNIIEELGV